MSGPYETEREAIEAVRHIHGLEPGLAPWTESNLGLLYGACNAAGVMLGEYDAQVLAWLARWEPQTCAVVAGLITRAHAAGQEPGGPGTAQPGGGWISGPST